ncbi:MAG: ribose 5-phosphate isomerase A [Anaerolineales bacterium]|nr:ribose 5-phosphate isomerase A [Anaerolineales bacterium]
MTIEDLKKQAAEKAVEQVKSGMVLGLGTGSSAKYATMKIGELWQAGQLADIVGIPTSEGTVTLAAKYGLPLTTLDEYALVDLAIDGADEIDPQLNLIKGLGGALLREKMIESATKRFIVVADGSKVVEKLGTRAPVPVEVVQFCWKTTARWLESLGCTPAIRGGESQPYVTDNGNYILDCRFPTGIDHPAELAAILKNRSGVVEHGLFLGMATEAIVATEIGLQAMQRP